MGAEGILPTPDDTPELPPAPRRRTLIICDCCESTLGADGGIIKTGERAKKFARGEDKLDKLEAEIVELKERLAKTSERLHAAELELQQDRPKPSSDRF